MFYQKWVLAGRGEQIPEPGDYMLFEIEDESIIISRTKTGEISANFNVCRHRGTRMCVEAKGHFESKNIQCPYHAWTYGLDGKLIASPMMQSLESFDKEARNLHQAHVHLWGGFIFLNWQRNLYLLKNKWEHYLVNFSIGNWVTSGLLIALSMSWIVTGN